MCYKSLLYNSFIGGAQDVPPYHEDQWKQVRKAVITLKKVPTALAVYLKKKAIFSFFLKEV